MDIGKSTRVALARIDQPTRWLANQLDVSYERARRIQQKREARTDTIERLAALFHMKVWEFIRLGED